MQASCHGFPIRPGAKRATRALMRPPLDHLACRAPAATGPTEKAKRVMSPIQQGVVISKMSSAANTGPAAAGARRAFGSWDPGQGPGRGGLAPPRGAAPGKLDRKLAQSGRTGKAGGGRARRAEAGAASGVVASNIARARPRCGVGNLGRRGSLAARAEGRSWLPSGRRSPFCPHRCLQSSILAGRFLFFVSFTFFFHST